jgi:hypothetical protein
VEPPGRRAGPAEDVQGQVRPRQPVRIGLPDGPRRAPEVDWEWPVSSSWTPYRPILISIVTIDRITSGIQGREARPSTVTRGASIRTNANL